MEQHAKGRGLRDALNASTPYAPEHEDEVRLRLSASRALEGSESTGEGGAERPETPDTGASSPPDNEPSRPELPTGSTPSHTAAPHVADRLEGQTARGEESPSLEEVIAQLSARADDFAKLETQLEGEEMTVDALDGQLCLTVTGRGALVSLHVDRAALKGPDRSRLGEHISELILTARQAAYARRVELESGFLNEPSDRRAQHDVV